MAVEQGLYLFFAPRSIALQRLTLLPVGPLAADPRSAPGPLSLPHAAGPVQGVGLWRDDGGTLRAATPAEDEAGSWELLAELAARPTAAGPAWWLAPRCEALTINGAVPLPLAALEGGDLLAAGSHWWLVATEWAPEPMAAPADLADKPCPVCGGALKLAPVCRCPCGRYYHLESPQTADGGQALNCDLAGPCGLCGRRPSLEPVLFPEPPAKLLSQETIG